MEVCIKHTGIRAFTSVYASLNDAIKSTGKQNSPDIYDKEFYVDVPNKWYTLIFTNKITKDKYTYKFQIEKIIQ